MEQEDNQGRDGRTRHRRHRGYLLIPAGVLLGLGVGMFAGYPGSGVLIGLGLGFIGAAMFPFIVHSPGEDEGAGAASPQGQVILALVGIFLVATGIGLFWEALTFWPWISTFFIILLGLWFVYRTFFPRK